MELFDKKFVHFIWEENLEGKEGFFADDICELTNCVLGDNLHFTKVRKSLSPAFPFKDTNNNDWLFFYYDPNYAVKKAYMEGKQIQYMFRNVAKWDDVNDADIDAIERMGLSWFDDDCKYRIKPASRRMTYRQTAEWAIKQNGEIKSPADPNYVFCDFSYREGLENEELPEGFQLRRWGSDEWIEPTLDVYAEDCRKGV